MKNTAIRTAYACAPASSPRGAALRATRTGATAAVTPLSHVDAVMTQGFAVPANQDTGFPPPREKAR